MIAAGAFVLIVSGAWFGAMALLGRRSWRGVAFIMAISSLTDMLIMSPMITSAELWPPTMRPLLGGAWELITVSALVALSQDEASAGWLRMAITSCAALVTHGLAWLDVFFGAGIWPGELVLIFLAALQVAISSSAYGLDLDWLDNRLALLSGWWHLPRD